VGIATPTAWNGEVSIRYVGSVEERELLIPKVIAMLKPLRKDMFIRAIAGREALTAEKATRAANPLLTNCIEQLGLFATYGFNRRVFGGGGNRSWYFGFTK